MATVSDIVILARTQMNDNRVCVGGYSLQENRYVRLLVKENFEQIKSITRFNSSFKTECHDNNYLKNMKETEPYHIGEVYTIEYENRDNVTPPHHEDVIVFSSSLKYRPNNYGEFLQFLSRIAIPNMHIKNLFNGLLQWQNKRGFLTENDKLPNNSVIVVRLNHDLFLSKFNTDYYYYKDSNLNEAFEVKYVGIYDKSGVKKIPAGAFLRFSIARWWNGNGQFSQKRAYLQLSAIY